MQDKTKHRQSTVAVCGLVFGLLMLVNMALADPPVFFAPTTTPFGKKLREWSAEWWQFVLSIPASENPLLDDTGQKCAVGQRGPVWFLVGTTGGPVTRACSLPEGKALFFPVLNLVDFNVTNQTA